MKKQVRMHKSISHVRWAGALMEVRSLFGLISAVKKKWLPTDRPTDRLTDRRRDKASYRDAWTHLKRRMRRGGEESQEKPRGKERKEKEVVVEKYGKEPKKDS